MDEEIEKKPRIFRISDETYKTICSADRSGLDPSVGLENLVSIFLSLSGPIDFKELDLQRAKKLSEKLLHSP